MKSLLGIVLIGLTIFCYAEVWGADWKLYGEATTSRQYYDSESITRPSQNIVRVWVKLSYTDKGIINMVGKYGAKYKELSFALVLWEFDCAEKKLRTFSETLYSDNGGVLETSPAGATSEWKLLPPESMAILLLENICK
jgi:hypothetical protein